MPPWWDRIPRRWYEDYGKGSMTSCPGGADAGKEKRAPEGALCFEYRTAPPRAFAALAANLRFETHGVISDVPFGDDNPRDAPSVECLECGKGIPPRWDGAGRRIDRPHYTERVRELGRAPDVLEDAWSEPRDAYLRHSETTTGSPAKDVLDGFAHVRTHRQGPSPGGHT